MRKVSLRRLCAFALLSALAGCGGSSNTPTTPTVTTFTLSGLVTDSITGKGISGATVSIGDGPNAGKAAVTDGSGNYNFSGLQQSGFTVNASVANYTALAKGVTLTSNQTLSFQLVPIFANVAGTWLGTMQYTQSPNGSPAQFTQAVSISLTQTSGTVAGTWSTTNGVSRNGTVGGGMTGNSFSGSFTYNATAANGGACTGTIAVSGSVSGNSLTWTSPGIVENCTDPPTTITFTAVKQ